MMIDRWLVLFGNKKVIAVVFLVIIGIPRKILGFKTPFEVFYGKILEAS
jgi:uncharacterized membrane protein